MDFNFEKLTIYQKANNFVDQAYILTRKYSKEEMFGLVAQLRRAAVSISINIAEGSARTKKDFSRFLDMARGSAFECVAILEISLRQKYIDKIKFNELKKSLAEIAKMISVLKRSIR